MGLDHAELVSVDDISSHPIEEVEKKPPMYTTAIKQLA